MLCVPPQESTLKSVLSALWNLSAHCSDNKAELCAVGGALGFLARALAQRGPASAALAVVESAGGILRNVSSLVATNQAYRLAFTFISVHQPGPFRCQA